ncbi:MAG: 16S rRNA (cytosine(1402)-N(4))-methyltransferase RsmH [Methylococcaceae bacterium]
MIHRPVMLQEVVDGLVTSSAGRYIDGTFGRGGHSQGILAQMNNSGKLLAFDKDLEAIMSEEASQLTHDKRFSLEHRCFSEMAESVAQLGWDGQVDGILLDLGVSSPQLDQPERGFSFQSNGPLDMRMDTTTGVSAAEWLATVDEKELIEVLKTYGEERFARRIVRNIVETRKLAAISTTDQLATIVSTSVPIREKHKHPATRTFQAIRIKLNRELDFLQQGLSQAVDVLKPGGRLVVISFHSLEDRIVKRFMRDHERGEYSTVKLPFELANKFNARLKRKGKAMRASQEEVAQNPRSRSAVLRIAEKVS